MKKYDPYLDRLKIVYCCRKNDEKYATKILGSIDTCALIKTRKCIIVVDFNGLIQRRGI